VIRHLFLVIRHLDDQSGHAVNTPEGGQRGMAADKFVVAGQHPLVVYQSDARERQQTGVWIADALAGGEKVFYTYQSTAHSGKSAIGKLTGVSDGSAALDSGQLEIIDAGQCYADTGGEHQALIELHVALMARARKEGYARVAMTADGAALHVMAPDREQLLAYERSLNLLTTDPDVRSLCRYDLRTEQPNLTAQIAGLHYQRVEDVVWSSEQQIGKLVVRGEIDMSNAERFAAVLHAAAADGVRILDLAETTFMAVAGTARLARFAKFLYEHGEELVLVNVPPIVMRILSVLDFTERVGAEVIPMEDSGEFGADVSDVLRTAEW
jgi:anti-anti-sigma factor